MWLARSRKDTAREGGRAGGVGGGGRVGCVCGGVVWLQPFSEKRNYSVTSGGGKKERRGKLDIRNQLVRPAGWRSAHTHTHTHAGKAFCK